METSIVSREVCFADLGTPELFSELRNCVAISEENFRRIAEIVRILEGRGEDLSELRIGLLSYFRKIAYGQMLPGVLARFCERREILNLVCQLPSPDQQRLADGGSITVVVRQDDVLTTRQMDPIDVPRRLIPQIFARGSIRTEAQQIAFLEGSSVSRVPSKAKSSIVLDKKSRSFRVGRHSLMAEDLFSALSQLNDAPTLGAECSSVSLDANVVKFLRIQAAKRGTSIKDLIAKACNCCGLLSN